MGEADGGSSRVLSITSSVTWDSDLQPLAWLSPPRSERLLGEMESPGRGGRGALVHCNVSTSFGFHPCPLGTPGETGSYPFLILLLPNPKAKF